MPHFSFSSLRVRLILMVLLAVIPALALILLTGMEQRQTAAAVAQHKALQLTLKAAESQDELIESTRQFLVGLTLRNEVYGDDPVACSALLADSLKTHPFYASLRVINRNGDRWCSAIPSNSPTNYSDRVWFQEVMRTHEFTIGGYAIGKVVGKPVAIFAQPILNEMKQVQAVIAVGLDLGWLDQLVANQDLPSGSVLTVIDGSGIILARSLEPEKWIGQPAIEAPIVRTILARQDQGTVESVGLDGVNRLYAFAPLGSAEQAGNIYVYVGIPTAIAYASADRALARNLILLGLATLLAMLMAWGVGDLTIVRHVNALIAMTRQVGAGDLSARTKLAGGTSEINKLARAFDQMADSLQHREAARKRAEDAVLRERDFATQVMNTLGQGVTVTDSDGRFTYVNPAYARMLGVVPDELVGKRPADVTVPEDQNILARQRTPRLSGETTTYETCLRRTDGEVVPVLIAGTPRWQDAKVIGTIAAISDLTEQKRSEREIRQNAARAEALARAAARLNAQLDLALVLRTVCDIATDYLNAPSSLYLANETDDAFVLATVKGLPASYLAEHKPIPRTVYEAYAQQMGPVINVPDVQAVPALADNSLYKHHGVRTIITASLIREGRVIGGLNVYSVNEPRTFTQDELALLQGLADQAVQAIINSRLFLEVQQTLDQLKALHEIDMAIIGGVDVRLVLRVVLDRVIAHLHVDAADVLTHNPVTHTLDFAAGRGFRSDALQHTHLRLGEGYAGEAALRQRLIEIPNLIETPNGLSRAPLLATENFIAYFAMPLVTKGQVIGVMELFHRAPLIVTPEWRDLLEGISNQTAIALDNVQMFAELQNKSLELSLAYDATLEGWSRALDQRDKETEGHSQRVMEMTLRLARAAGMVQAELVHVRRGALLHDIGKIGIPDAILLKSDKLTNEEWDIMRQHPRNAFELLSPIPYLRPALDIPYCHHEKWDGSGYPRGLKAEEIPLAARLFAVVDVYDALRSDRPYRSAWPEDKVREHIRSLAGTHFDPKAVQLFFQALGENALVDKRSAG